MSMPPDGVPDPAPPGRRQLFRTAMALGWRASPPLVVAAVALSVLTAVLPVGAALLTKSVLDLLTRREAGSPWRVVEPALALGVVGVLAAVLPRVGGYARSELSRRVGRLSKETLYAAVGRYVGIAPFEDPQTLDRLRMAESAARMTPTQTIDGTLSAGQGLLTIAGFLITLTVLAPVMAISLLVAAVPVLVAELWISRGRATMLFDIEPIQRRELFFSQLLTDVSAAKEIRLFGTGEHLRRRMIDELRAADAEKRRLDVREAVVQGLLAGFGALVAGAGLVWAVAAAWQGRLTVGDVSVFVASVAGIQGALVSLVVTLGNANEALLLLAHYEAVIRDTADGGVGPAAELPSPVAAGDAPGLELDDVWFRYGPEHPWVLQGVSLRVPPGGSLALVGENGAGKSSVVKLLCRFYDPERGSIRWDGQDLRSMDPAVLRDRISAVFQDFMAYDLTGRENIELGRLGVGTDRIEAAAREAEVHDVLTALPFGYDTLLSRLFLMDADKDDPQTGIVLSGGQWQRLALARSLVRRDCELMILDEPSAGLDPQAEHRLHTRLTEHRRGRMSVLVSHRLNAVRDADTIAVLADGRVTESGSHRELMARGGIYHDMFVVQSSGYQQDAADPQLR